jgi:hypothetical protein
MLSLSLILINQNSLTNLIKFDTTKEFANDYVIILLSI